MASFGDQRIDQLVSTFSQASEELAELMSQMVEADREDRHAIYALILAILLRLRKAAQEWSEVTVAGIYAEALQEAADDLISQGYLGDLIGPDQGTHEVQRMADSFLADTEGALSNVRSVAVRLRNGQTDRRFLTGTLVVGLSAGGVRAIKARRRIKQSLREGMMAMLAKDGKIYHYSLDYYVGMVAQQIKYKTMSRAVLNQMQFTGHDLVQISPNPSTIGDYCDEYRGKVFSISGTDPHYPPLAETPSGGPPFHPHCHHTLQPYVDRAIAEMGPVDPKFLEMGRTPGMGPNDFQKLWRAKRAG